MIIPLILGDMFYYVDIISYEKNDMIVCLTKYTVAGSYSE